MSKFNYLVVGNKYFKHNYYIIYKNKIKKL